MEGGRGEMRELELEKWDLVGPELKLTQLEDLEADGVNIQCVNSSEFVVGKQTNFNGPVTIINCENVPEGKRLEEGKDGQEGGKEKIVIRDKVLSQSAAMTVQEMAGKGGGSPEKSRWKVWAAMRWGKVRILPLLLFCSLLLTTAVALGVLYLKRDADAVEPRTSCLSVPRKGGESCLYSEFPWGGGPGNDSEPMETPVPYVIVAQTHGPDCFFPESCFQVLQDLQQSEKSERSCNFLVGSDGNIYEGLGWRVKNWVEGFTAGKNVRLCFIGDFEEFDFPTYPQVEGMKALIDYGVRHDYISPQYTLFPSDVISPGDKLFEIYKIIKKWPHFVAEEQNGFHIYSKEEWGGLPPTSAIGMKLPIPYVIISHSVSSECRGLQACSRLLKNIQDYHFTQEYADIAYNFLVDSSGNVYEGRGWSNRNIKGGFVNGRSINVNVLGDFSKDVFPSEEQLDGVKMLIFYGLDFGKISQNYSLIADNATHPTLSPGKNVYSRIKYWPHFDPEPKKHLLEFEDR